MSTDINLFERELSTAASALMQRTGQMAEQLHHAVIDPSHLLLAALKDYDTGAPRYFDSASYPLAHPIHQNSDRRYVVDPSLGLGLDFGECLKVVNAAFPAAPKRPVVEHYTPAMLQLIARSLELSDEMLRSNAPVAYERKPRIYVVQLAWAAVESGSPVVDHLVPDKLRAAEAFFPADEAGKPTAPASVLEYTARQLVRS